MVSPPADFESAASTDSAIPARRGANYALIAPAPQIPARHKPLTARARDAAQFMPQFVSSK
jgi:hypothetical protein